MAGGRVDPVVLLHQAGGPLASYLIKQSLPFITHAWMASKLERGSQPLTARLLMLPTMARLLLSHKIHVVHTHDDRMHRLWAPVASALRVRVVWHHRKVLRSPHLSPLARCADRFVAISQCAKASLPAWASARTVVIDNPVEPNRLPPDQQAASEASRARVKAGSRRLRIGTVAKTSEQKRSAWFVSLAAHLAETIAQPLTFALVGEVQGEEGQRVRQSIRWHGLEDRFQLPGAQFPIDPWLREFDVLVAPAVREAFGRTLVEAMLQRTPVVAADHAGHREVIQHGSTGWLVPPDDPEGFRDAIEEILADTGKTKQVVDRAYNMARERYALKRHVARIEDVYRDLR